MYFEIKARVYMKPYNEGRYWIDRDCMEPHTVCAENVEEALKIYARDTRDGNGYFAGVEISENAIKKNNRDYFYKSGDLEHAAGIIVTGKTEIWDRSANVAGSLQYVDVYITVRMVENILFCEEDIA